MLFPTTLVVAFLHFTTFTHGQLFIVNCNPLTVQRSDPIVSPGVASSHVHAVVGGTNFKRTQSNEDAVNAKETTCDKMLDKSNYWIPNLYHENKNGTFTAVPFQGSAAYYLARACNYAQGRRNCPGGNGQAAVNSKAPPKGLRMVAGNPTLRTYNQNDFAQRAISHVCLDPGAETPELPNKPCKRMRAQVFFPSCWDGKSLDSADHKSHMAYPAIGDYNGGVCPSSHPEAIFSVFYEFFFDTGVFSKDFNRLVYAQGDASGYGLHGDYLQGWTDQNALERSMSTCTGNEGVNSPNCSLRVNGKIGQAATRKPETAEPNENVGLNGPIPQLPGNNPVTGKGKKRGVERNFSA